MDRSERISIIGAAGRCKSNSDYWHELRASGTRTATGSASLLASRHPQLKRVQQERKQQSRLHRPKISTHRTCSMSLERRQSYFLFVTLLCVLGSGLSNPQDAEHLTAMVGDSIVFNCHVEFPEAHPVPYVIQWEKRGVEIPIFIWYENYLHVGDGYEGRVSRVNQPGSTSSHYGLASLNLTRIRESDQGWYSCLVNFLNRSPRQDKNGTLFHLNVHAPPRFTMTPDDVVYVSLGDPIILSCLAEGTPTPEILWYRENELVHTSPLLAVVNDGTELRISSIRQEDVGDYTCTAKNGQGIVRHTTKLVVAGGAVIVVPPINVTRLEGDKLEMPCEARGLPGNFSVVWYRENHAVRSIPWLESRTLVKRDGSLVISPVHSDDRGLYACEVTNGIGEPQRASAFLDVEYPARVTFTPTVQYLPLKLSGIVRCHVEAHPPFQFITWTKDKRIFDPFETPNVGVLKNGSLLFEKVSQENQGRYTCTPYNVHGTAGSSAVMEVLVREPPVFLSRPKSVYQQKIDDDVQMICDAQGSPSPRISWRRMDGRPLPRDRAKEESGVLTLSKLRRSDFGYYECHVSNEVATLIATAHLVVEGTTPHAPYNITTESTEFSVSLEWLPGYSGGSDYTQNYVIWYRQEGASQWIPMDVEPPSSTKTVIHNLQPGTTYEFQVIGKNVLGDGMFSNIVKERTKGQRPPDPPPPGPSRATTSPAPVDTAVFKKYHVVEYPKDAGGFPYLPKLGRPSGPSPSPPENVTVTETSDGVILSWAIPKKPGVATAYLTVDYCYDDQWRRLSKTELKPHETSFKVTNLNAGKTYMFRINAHTLTNQASSDKISYILQKKIKDKAITAGVVGGILFLIVAIILAVCTVKCVNKRNKRRRREQEKAYSMVACQVSDVRNGNPTPTKTLPPRKGWTGRLPAVSSPTFARELLNFCFTHHRTSNEFKITSLVETNSSRRHHQRERQASEQHRQADNNDDDYADWLEYHGHSDERRHQWQQRLSRRPLPSLYNNNNNNNNIHDEKQSSLRRVDQPLFVESGVYKVGGDRIIWPRPKPILHTEISPVPTYETLLRYGSKHQHSASDETKSGIFHASFASTYKEPYSIHHELPALLPIHRTFQQQQQQQTVQAEVHSSQRKPPPFRPPPSPRLRSQRPLATSSPPTRRPSPLLVAVRTLPSRTYLSRANAIEYSPQSQQSSSSGFDSKNTSSNQNNQSSGFFSNHSEQPAYENWPLRSALTPILDASVDTHYEFDATLSLTETTEPGVSSSTSYNRQTTEAVTTRNRISNSNKPATSGFNIDARVQAMKQEFNEYRKRRARHFLESAC